MALKYQIRNSILKKPILRQRPKLILQMILLISKEANQLRHIKRFVVKTQKQTISAVHSNKSVFISNLL